MKYKQTEIYNIIPQLDGIITHKVKAMYKLESNMTIKQKLLLVGVVVAILGTLIIEILR